VWYNKGMNKELKMANKEIYVVEKRLIHWDGKEWVDGHKELIFYTTNFKAAENYCKKMHNAFLNGKSYASREKAFKKKGGTWPRYSIDGLLPMSNYTKVSKKVLKAREDSDNFQGVLRGLVVKAVENSNATLTISIEK